MELVAVVALVGAAAVGGLGSFGGAWRDAVDLGVGSGALAGHAASETERHFAPVGLLLSAQAAEVGANDVLREPDGGRSPWERIATLVNRVALAPFHVFGKILKLGLSGFGTLIRFLAGSGFAPSAERVALPYDGRIPLTLYRPPLDGSGGPAVSAGDVNQGTLGSCVTLSGIAAVAHQNPSLIEDAIRDNGDGTYTVRFHVQRPPLFFWEPAWTVREVTVDARVPLNEHGHPAYAAAPGGELWVLVLEKAWAEVNGGWQHINGDLGFGLLEALTGKSSFTNYAIRGVSFGAGQRSPEYLSRLLGEGYAVLAGSLKKTADGVVNSHTHYIKAVDAEGNVTLGNPWGEDDEITVTWEVFKRNFGRIEYAATR